MIQTWSEKYDATDSSSVSEDCRSVAESTTRVPFSESRCPWTTNLAVSGYYEVPKFLKRLIVIPPSTSSFVNSVDFSTITKVSRCTSPYRSEQTAAM